MKETLLVKHAVGGRTFIDSGKHPVPYEVKEKNGGWTFTVEMPMNGQIGEILRWKNELNVFLFTEIEGEPTRKSWFYVADGPVEYDEQRERLTIQARSRIDYVPELFGSGWK